MRQRWSHYTWHSRRRATITVRDGALTFSSSYRPDLVQELKEHIPPSERRWSPERKVWITTPKHIQFLRNLVERHLHVEADVIGCPEGPVTAPLETRLLEIRYLANCKEWSEEKVAFGWYEGSWNAIFPEAVLRQWFGGRPERPVGPGEPATYYEVLGIKEEDALGAGIRNAFRRLARMWHPDVCREPGAASQFKRINEAYTILSNPKLKTKYDAGLELEKVAVPAEGEKMKPTWIRVSYRAPLLCGLVKAEGREKLGRFIVSKILGWEDIRRGDGKVLISSWPEGAERFVEVWV